MRYIYSEHNWGYIQVVGIVSYKSVIDSFTMRGLLPKLRMDKLSAHYTQCNGFASKFIGSPSGDRSAGIGSKKRYDNKQNKKREIEKR